MQRFCGARQGVVGRLGSAVCAAMALSAATAGFASERAAIQKQYDRFARAYVQHDIETMLAILTPDYSLRSTNGKIMLFAEYKATLEKRKAAGTKTGAYQTRILNLKVLGETAYVATEEISRTLVWNAKAKRRQVVVHTHQYQDVWARQENVWRLKRTEAKGETSRTEPAPRK